LENALFCIDTTLGGIETVVNPIHPLNAYELIEASFVDNVIELSNIQSWNTFVPIAVILLGRIIEGSAEHPLNALFPMVNILSGKTIVVNAVQFSNELGAIEIISPNIDTVCKLLHPLNKLRVINNISRGSVIDVNDVQFWNIFTPKL
jgi:hypothetical protein